jgi:hypothetical protein
VAVDQAGAFYTFETVHTADRRHPHPADRLQRPWPPGCEPTEDPRVEAVAHAARELVERRDAWLNPPDASEAELGDRTLTRLYNARPAGRDQAHRKLDRAVLAAYGWPRELSDDEILERLLALNLQREPA